jgi:uncharacterized membrane protein
MTDTPPPRDIAPYRQPMVTSIGIILGFLLNFLANWATEDEDGDTLLTLADYAVAGTLLLSIAMMCGVLFRLLDIRKADHMQEAHYIGTFRLYVACIVTAFAGVGLALFL